MFRPVRYRGIICSTLAGWNDGGMPPVDEAEPLRLVELLGAISLALPSARFVELASSGHVPYAERPDDFARAVAAFASEITAPQLS
jgi:pimeloyl-ACP methyl ester carboxylesterase